MADQQILGSGELYFAPYKPGTSAPDGERYLGNTPAFSLNVTTNKLDHYNSDSGLKEKDKSVTISTDRMGTFTCDAISLENLALFFFGTAETVTVTPATAVAETIADVGLDRWYQLGTTATAPSGARKLTNVVVKKGATTLTLNTDYELNADLGRIHVLSGGTLVAGDDLDITYDVAGSTRTRVISGNTPIEGVLRFVSYNNNSEQRDYFMPRVKLSPDGDLALKGEDWQQMSFSVEVLRKTGLNAIYIDGRPS